MTNFAVSNVDRKVNPEMILDGLAVFGLDNKINLVGASGLLPHACIPQPTNTNCSIQVGEEKIIEGVCKKTKTESPVQMRILTENKLEQLSIATDYEFPLYVTLELPASGPYFFCAKDADTDVQIEYVDVTSLNNTLDKFLTYDDMIRKIYSITDEQAFPTFDKCVNKDEKKICVPRYIKP